MLVGIIGDVGSGKTVYAVRCAKKDYDNGKKIIANLELFDIEYEKFDLEKMFDEKYRKDLRNATLIIDEITVYMDCRLSMSKQNLLMGYLVALQGRKRNLDTYFTSQAMELLDYNRLLKYTKVFVFAEEIFYRDKKTGEVKEIDDYRNYTIVDMRKRDDRITQFRMNISPYYGFYDTDEIIEPKMLLKK